MENTNRVRGKASQKNLTIQGRTIPSGYLEGGGGVIGGRNIRTASSLLGRWRMTKERDILCDGWGELCVCVGWVVLWTGGNMRTASSLCGRWMCALGCLVLCRQKRTYPTHPQTSQDRDPHIESAPISRAPSSILEPRVSLSMLDRPLSIMDCFQNGIQHIHHLCITSFLSIMIHLRRSCKKKNYIDHSKELIYFYKRYHK